MRMWQNLNTSTFTFTRSYNDLVSTCKLIKDLRNNVVLAEIDTEHLLDYIGRAHPKKNSRYMKALDELHKDGAINIHRLGGGKILLYIYPRFIPFLDMITSWDPWPSISRKLGYVVYSGFDISEIQRD